jgi:hypothetical protein
VYISNSGYLAVDVVVVLLVVVATVVVVLAAVVVVVAAVVVVAESVVVVSSVEVITSVVVSSDEESSFLQPQEAKANVTGIKRIKQKSRGTQNDKIAPCLTSSSFQQWRNDSHAK